MIRQRVCLSRIKNLIIKYNSLFLYSIFGVATVCVNTVIYYILYSCIGLRNIASVAIAWMIAVLFAFITNKIFVFGSRNYECRIILYEFLTFLGCRLATGIIDIGIMYVSVDKFGLNSMVWKTISNLLVIIINFIASKWIVFHRKGEKKQEDYHE